eukprot:754694-Hanusia_phi.AAC.4
MQFCEQYVPVEEKGAVLHGSLVDGKLERALSQEVEGDTRPVLRGLTRPLDLRLRELLGRRVGRRTWTELMREVEARMGLQRGGL